MDWILRTFDQLTPKELYAIIRLRNEIFVVEQDCVYQDADDKDWYSFHLCGFLHDELAAYARIFPPGDYYKEAAIGRVAIALSARRKKYGKQLMKIADNVIYRYYGNVPTRLGAQYYAISFYASIGFLPEGEEYLEDDIPHIEMIKPAQ